MLETLLAELTARGLFIKLAQSVNATVGPCYVGPAPKQWWVTLYDPTDGGRQHGYGDTLAEALTDALTKEPVYQPLQLYEPSPDRPSLAGLVPTRPTYVRRV